MCSSSCQFRSKLNLGIPPTPPPRHHCRLHPPCAWSPRAGARDWGAPRRSRPRSGTCHSESTGGTRLCRRRRRRGAVPGTRWASAFLRPPVLNNAMTWGHAVTTGGPRADSAGRYMYECPKLTLTLCRYWHSCRMSFFVETRPAGRVLDTGLVLCVVALDEKSPATASSGALRHAVSDTVRAKRL